MKKLFLRGVPQSNLVLVSTPRRKRVGCIAWRLDFSDAGRCLETISSYSNLKQVDPFFAKTSAYGVTHRRPQAIAEHFGIAQEFKNPEHQIQPSSSKLLIGCLSDF